MRLRHNIRSLILDDHDRVLLIGYRWSDEEPHEAFWTLPGGHLEPGEPRLEALQRALHEQTGLLVPDLGPEVWTRTARITAATALVEHVHLLHTDRLTPGNALAPTSERESVGEPRWWSRAQLHDAPAVFSPQRLPELLDRLVQEGVPSPPLAIDGF